MRFKKFAICIALACVTALVGITFAGCVEDKDGYTLVVPDGAAVISAAGLIGDAEGNVNLDVSVVSAGVISVEALRSDFAVVPSNTAALLYNRNGGVKLLATLTHGNLYMLSTREGGVSVGDLTGKNVIAIGQGAVPDLLFKTLVKSATGRDALSGDGTEEGAVTISYGTDGSDVIARLMLAKKEGREAYGIVGEPAVSKGKAKGLFEAMDLQEEWREYRGAERKGYPQAVLIAVGEAAADAALCNKVVAAFGESAAWASEHPEAIRTRVASVFPQTVLPDFDAETAARCNVSCVPISQDKAEYAAMLEAIFEVSPSALGGKLPDDGFYFSE